MWKHYGISHSFTVIGIALGYVIGGLQGAWIVAILAILEISLSFDNAVVNASVLKNWDETWRRRFLVWGLPIAVFGMRFVFPLLIVAVIADMNPFAVLTMAIDEPDRYSSILLSSHHEVAAFGGAFLMMVFLKYFMDSSKGVHWISFIEKPLSKIGHLEAIEVATTLGVILLFSTYQTVEHQLEFIFAGVCGLITYVLAESVGSFVGEDGDGDQNTKIIKQGVGGFMYLELLDSSFSFDGVLAAVSLSNNIFIIAIGLGIGAFYVRSMTIHLLEKGTLAEYIFLETGAFYAIGFLASLMFIGTIAHVPETVVGTLSAVVIVASLIHSVLHKRKTAG